MRGGNVKENIPAEARVEGRAGFRETGNVKEEKRGSRTNQLHMTLAAGGCRLSNTLWEQCPLASGLAQANPLSLEVIATCWW